MKPPPYPKIKGVQFRPIPKFPGYAMSSDKRVWLCAHWGRWTPLEPRHYGTGPNSVWLLFPNGSGGGMAFDIDDLFKRVFGGRDGRPRSRNLLAVRGTKAQSRRGHD